MNAANVNDGAVRVIRHRTWWSRRTVVWEWTGCNGEPHWILPWTDADGHTVDMGDPPHACTTGPDFTCPVHVWPDPIQLGVTP